MDLLVAAVLGAAVAGAIGAALSALHRIPRRRHAREELLLLAARRARLKQLEQRGNVLTARDGELEIQLEPHDSGNEGRGTRITIRGPSHPAGSLSIRLESMRTALDKRLRGAVEVEIGDSRFDDLAFVEGPPALALAVLTRSVRGLLREVLRGWSTSPVLRASLENGELQLDAREHTYVPGSEVGAVLPTALRLAHGLQPPQDLAQRLAENLRSERRPQVRRRIVETLAAEFGEHPLARAALVAACHDRSEDVRLQAAIGLGVEGRRTLSRLVSNERASDRVRAQAVAALGPALAGDLLERALREALEHGATATARACLRSMGARGRREAEPLLLQALDSEQPEVALAAAEALGSCGGAVAVARLLELADTASRIGLREAARRTVAVVQSRLPGAGRGQLSLSERGAEGALSLADAAPGGDLSLVVAPAGFEPPSMPAAGDSEAQVDAAGVGSIQGEGTPEPLYTEDDTDAAERSTPTDHVGIPERRDRQPSE